MLNFTPLARRLMERRVKAAEGWKGNGIEAAQRKVLRYLTSRGAHTALGRECGMCATDSFEIFKTMVPGTRAYPDIRAQVMRMVEGEKDVLWPGRCRRFAQSSGTSDGHSKFIPVTADSLRLNHYPGATDAVAHYLHLYPSSRMFAGKGFILGGSFATELQVPEGVRVGDLSANLIEAVNPLINLVRVPSREIALMEDWRQKVPALVAASKGCDITNISGVPSWFLTVIKEVIRAAGASTIHDVWPNLEVFFHGGISMEPYRREYARLTDPSRMHYRETYNASEGFFAVQDHPDPGSMLLLLDAGVFYEFAPLDSADEPDSPTLAAWQVEQGRTYALIITAANGLWRYRIGDTVRIVSADPLRIAIAGRTKHYINAFGEEVMVYNTDRALAKACASCACEAANYTVAPVFADRGRRGRHQWLIEWSTPPTDSEAFADALDMALQEENSDYQAKRSGSIFLDRLSVTDAPEGTFDHWLASTGKLGGQRKVPRLSNDRRLMDLLLKSINKNTDIPAN